MGLDLENLVALQAAAAALHRIGDDEGSVSQRSTEIQRLGEEIEQRAKALVAEVRTVRGLRVEEAPARAPRIAAIVGGTSSAPPPPPESQEVDGKLNGGRVRDAMMSFKDGFMIDELAAFLGAPVKDVKKFIDIWATSGVVKPTGFRIGRKVQYQYVKPEGSSEARPTRRPPEREPPAGTERRATGTPVRVSPMKKATRKQRSTAGRRHQMVMQDRRYEQMMSAREKRANEQRFKSLRDDAAKKKGGKKGNRADDRAANTAKRIEAEARARAQAK